MDRDAWRAQLSEPIIEPDLPIIDAHHHIWPEMPFPGLEAYPDETLIAEVAGSGHAIIATVAVEALGSYRQDGPEALRPVGETEHAEALARRVRGTGGRASGLCAAIVAHADLRLGDGVAEVLDAHRAAAPDRFRGIRHMTVCDPDLPTPFGIPPGLMSDPAFRAGFAQLAAAKLSYDAYLVHPQLGELLDLAKVFPETVIVADHLGGPLGVGRFKSRCTEAFAAWRAALAPLAACKNVFVKLGGMHLDITGLGAIRADRPRSSMEMAAVHRDHILAVIDMFGPDHVMFESNFPVDRMSGPYDILWNCFKLMTAGFSPAERQAMFAGTARRVYRITPEQERSGG